VLSVKRTCTYFLTSCLGPKEPDFWPTINIFKVNQYTNQNTMKKWISISRIIRIFLNFRATFFLNFFFANFNFWNTEYNEKVNFYFQKHPNICNNCLGLFFWLILITSIFETLYILKPCPIFDEVSVIKAIFAKKI
jgi:magnesium-transporting ATPase (P-type)